MKNNNITIALLTNLNILCKPAEVVDLEGLQLELCELNFILLIIIGRRRLRYLRLGCFNNNEDGDDGQGSEKWIAQIAALLDKMPSVGQIRF